MLARKSKGMEWQGKKGSKQGPLNISSRVKTALWKIIKVAPRGDTVWLKEHVF